MQTPSETAPLLVLAAGSLRNVFVDIVSEFERQSGIAVHLEHGPAGLLREKIEEGTPFDVFASANMAHPERLRSLKLAGPVLRFTRNRLCVIARPGLGITPENLIDMMLDKDIKVGTSTPGADPSGDYAIEFFRKIDVKFPGKGSLLASKARALVGGRTPLDIPPGFTPAGWLIEQGLADVFVSYASNGLLGSGDETLQVLAIPDDLGPIAEYGVGLCQAPRTGALMFRNSLFSDGAKKAFLKSGFGC